MVEGKEMTKERVSFASSDLILEGVLHVPAGENRFPAVAICHPHPQFGGSMDNNVVDAAVQALLSVNVAALRFNFRGVGASQGRYDDGVGEQRDAASALAYLAARPEIDKRRLGLAGYSFGTKVAVPVAAENPGVKALCLISPFLGPFEWEKLAAFGSPKLLICGAEDTFISASEVAAFTDGLGGEVRFEIVSGADHMWWGSEGRIVELVSSFFKDTLTT